jgi:excisionase family DNA binding protein
MIEAAPGGKRMFTPVRLFSIERAAQYLGVSPRTVRTWMAGGRLPIVRLGRRVLVDQHCLDELIEGHTQRGKVTRQAVEGESRRERQTTRRR